MFLVCVCVFSHHHALMNASISSFLCLLRPNCLTAESPGGHAVWDETTWTALLASPSFIPPAETPSLSIRYHSWVLGDQARCLGVSGAVIVQPPGGRWGHAVPIGGAGAGMEPGSGAPAGLPGGEATQQKGLSPTWGIPWGVTGARMSFIHMHDIHQQCSIWTSGSPLRTRHAVMRQNCILWPPGPGRVSVWKLVWTWLIQRILQKQTQAKVYSGPTQNKKSLLSKLIE